MKLFLLSEDYVLKLTTLIAVFFLTFTGTVAVLAETASGEEERTRMIVLNPYENIDWKTVEKHKAALHFHTLQSDGFHMVAEAINAYRRAGFTLKCVIKWAENLRNGFFEIGCVA